MRFNKKIIILNLLPLLFTYIVYSSGVEINLIFLYESLFLIRILTKLYFPKSIKIEWIVFIYKILLLIFFYQSQYFGLHILTKVSFNLLLANFILLIFESIYYIYKTKSIIKDHNINISEVESTIVVNDTKQIYDVESKDVETLSNDDIKRNEIKKRIREDNNDYGDIDIF